MADGSVSKGSGFLVGARLGGLLGGFVLFLLLSWRSKEVVGIFRTSITFLGLMDTLPLFGMHRWLMTEIARQADRGLAIFGMACWFAAGVAVMAAGVYFGLACAGIYGGETSACLKVVALATIPSAINLCVTSALVGIGSSHQSGIITLVEMVTRSVLSIVLVLSGAGILSVIIVFALVRWIVAGAGLLLVRARLAGTRPRIDREIVSGFLAQVPNLAVSMIGFLIIRNAALLLLPWLRDESVAGSYAAPLQLFDLLLLIPTVLTISTNYTFTQSARQSRSSQRRNTNELASITAAYVFPLAAVACVIARPMIELLFGRAYGESVVPFQLLLGCAAVAAVDQVLSLSMVTAGDYRSDRICIVAGAAVALTVTIGLAGPWGASGAAMGLLAGSMATIGVRLLRLRGVLRLRSFAGSLQLQLLASLIAAASVWLALAWLEQAAPIARTTALLLAPAGGAVYLVTLYLSGGLSRRRILRFQAFMARRG